MYLGQRFLPNKRKQKMSILKVNTIESTGSTGVTYNNAKLVAYNNSVTDDITIASGKNALMAGPVTAGNVTVAGHLAVVNDLNITGTMDVTGSFELV